MILALGTVSAQSTTTTAQGCVIIKTGALGIVGSASAFKNGETALSWNQQGPQGAQGQPGTNGTDGQNGSGATTAGLGTEGDYYIDNQADAICGPKGTGGCGTPTS